LNPFRLAVAVCAAIFIVAVSAAQEPVDGGRLFETECRSCHDGNDARAPALDALHGRAPQAIVDSLTSGSMRYQGLHLSGAERRAIAEFITGRRLRGTLVGATLGRCASPAPLADPFAAPNWIGWSPTVQNTHFQPAAQARLTADQIPHLQLAWAFGFPDATSAWSQPTIAGGRLYVGSQNGIVYSLDAASGCIVWTFSAHAGVRTSISIGRITRASTGARGFSRASIVAAYFADQNGFVYAVDAATGREVWSRKADAHPLVRLTGSPTLFDGRLYVPLSSYEEGGKPPRYACCTFRGGVIAMDARTGDTIWRAYTIADPPTMMRVYADGTEVWGPSGGAVWSAPTIDARRGALYVGTGNTYTGASQPATDAVVAFDLKTGKQRWARQMYPGERDVFGCNPGEVNCGAKAGPDFDFGASPMLVTLPSGRDLVIAGQKSGVAYALDPDRKGEQVWRYRAGGGSGLGGIQWGIAADADQVYMPVADIYSETPGGLHAVSLQTGARAWVTPPPPPICGKPNRACNSAQFSAVTVIPGVVFSPSNDGALRAYSTKSGAIVWTFDTNREFQTLNGVRARGGSMNGPAPVVAGGMLYVGSGYGTFGLRPGNVLLAFGSR
jgi:polyvinyl alcohol dehydrogenase (cytochrome)